MKPDKLEKFVQQHRKDFDVFEPDDRMWESIASRSKPIRKINYRQVTWQVAAAIVIFVAAWYTRDIIQPLENKNTAESVENFLNPADENMKVLMEAEVFYTSKINTAREEIFRMSGNNESMMEMIDYDLVELDEIFEELKNDLKDNGDNQEVIEAMIQNYRLKLQILEEMMVQLSKSNNSEEKKDGYEI